MPSINLNPITVTAPGDTGVTTPPTPPVTTGPVIPPVTVIGSKDPGLVVPNVTPPVVVPPVVVPPVVPSIPVTPPVVVPPKVTTPPVVTPVVPTIVPPMTPPTLPNTTGAGLNPGWIAPPTYYKNTTPSQAQYYWGAHPYQPGPTFNASLYNQLPNAPATPWGATNAQKSASAADILAAMQGRYPLLGTTTEQIAGAIAPAKK